MRPVIGFIVDKEIDSGFWGTIGRFKTNNSFRLKPFKREPAQEREIRC